MRTFKKIGFLILGVVAIWGSVAEASEDVRVLSLQSTLMEIEQTNLSLLAAREGLEQAVEGIRRTRAGLLPSVKLVAGQSRNQNVTVGLGLEKFGVSRQSDPFSRFNAGVSVDVPLVNLVSIAAYRNAKYVSEISEFEYASAVEEIKLAVADSYVGALRAREGLELGIEALGRAEELRDITEDRVEAGAANRIDFMRAKLEVSQARQIVVSRETAVFMSEHQLKLFLDIDLSTKLELLPVEGIDSESLPSAESVDRRELLLQREDYLARLKEEDRAKLLVKAAGWQRLPSLSAYGNFGYVSEEAFDRDEEENWTLGVSFSIPLFEGGKNEADKAMAESHLSQTESRLREAEQAVLNEVEVAWQQLSEARSSVDLAGEMLELASETFRFALDRFQNGAGDNRELIEAQLGLSSAETNLSDSKLMLERRRLAYSSALGDIMKVNL